MSHPAAAGGAGDAAEPETGPERRCLVTGVVAPRETMLRFVVGPDGSVVPDVDERLPGRGMWLCARRDVVNTAVGKKAFSRAARAPVSAPADLAQRVEALLARRCVDLLGLARRAGQAVAGFEKVAQAVRGGSIVLLLEAVDGAMDGRRKLMALAPQLPVVAALTAAEMGHALGREHAVHVALSAGRLASMLRRETARLAGFREAAADV